MPIFTFIFFEYFYYIFADFPILLFASTAYAYCAYDFSAKEKREASSNKRDFRVGSIYALQRAAFYNGFSEIFR